MTPCTDCVCIFIIFRFVLTIHLIPFASPAYDESVALRDQVLRKPLGLEFTPEGLAEEYNQYHIAAFDQEANLIAILLLKPVEEATFKMRQVAVDPSWQKKGVGQKLVLYAEQFAKEKACQRIEMNARLEAVPFYEKLGYQRFGRKFKEVGIPHYKMKKVL